MSDDSTAPANLAAIAQALLQATDYVIPSVDDLFAAGIPQDSIDPSKIFNGSGIDAGTLWNKTINGLYYNVSYLWPYWQLTGPIVDVKDYCVPQVCSLLLGQFLYLPNIPGNAFFAAFFGLALLATIGLGFRFRTWGFMVGMIFGLLCEILGYMARIALSRNDFNKNYFYIYIICLTIGPAFLSFSIYTCLARIVVLYGKGISRFKPKTYTYIFAVCDFISLVLQALGGALATTAKDDKAQKRGVNIMIAGLAFQVFSLTVFMVLCADYAIRLHRRRSEKDATYVSVRQSVRFRGFLVALIVATVAIYVRSVFRVIELKEGLKSRFANDEITFMVLEGAMIGLSVIVLTIFHPGIAFGDLWKTISAQMKEHKGKHSPAGSDGYPSPRMQPAIGRPTQVMETPNKLESGHYSTSRY